MTKSQIFSSHSELKSLGIWFGKLRSSLLVEDMM